MSMPESTEARTTARTRLRQPVEPKRSTKQVVGGVPQVSLLPTEVRQAGSDAHHRRRLVAAVIVAALVAAGGAVVSGQMNDAAQARLASTEQESQILAAQLGKFNDVRELERKIALGEAAVKVGGATRIDWDEQLRAIEADKPIAYTVTNISASGASPLAAFSQGATVVEPRRSATVVMTLTTTGTVGDEFSTWIRRLRSIPTYADASASTSTDAAGIVTITLTVHLNPKAIIASGKATESE